MGKGQELYKRLAKISPSNEERRLTDAAKVKDIETKMLEDVKTKDSYLKKEKKEEPAPEEKPTTTKKRRTPRKRSDSVASQTGGEE